MKRRLPRGLHVSDQGLVLRDRVIQTRQMPAQAFVHGRRPQAGKPLRSRRGVAQPGALKMLAAGDEGVDGRFAVAQGRGEEIDAEALVGLARTCPRPPRSQRSSVVIGVMSPSAWRCRSASNSAPSEITVQVVPRARLSAT